MKRVKKSLDKKKESHIKASKASESLKSGQFRVLNELLYTQKGEESLKYFQENKEDYSIYHQGFANQVDKWKTNPLDIIIKELKKTKYEKSTIADIGCGTGRLAEQLKRPNIRSFDLVALAPHIEVANMCKLPLQNESVDISVFCLSLMSTDFIKALEQGARILRKGGLMIIAEVSSRIESLKDWIKCLKRMGFASLKIMESEKNYFSLFILRKEGEKRLKSEELQVKYSSVLKPCIYKRR